MTTHSFRVSGAISGDTVYIMKTHAFRVSGATSNGKFYIMTTRDCQSVAYLVCVLNLLCIQGRPYAHGVGIQVALDEPRDMLVTEDLLDGVRLEVQLSLEGR